MTESSHMQTTLPPDIRRMLARLRWRIRAYVWLEGLLVALLWLGLTFWSGMALDYLPVVMGASEMPLVARAVLLVIIGGVLAWLLYRWVVRRTFVRLADRSLALLLERRYANFHDGLVTAVELSPAGNAPSDINRAMVEHTSQAAVAQLGDVELRRVFRWRPVGMKLGLVALLVIPIAVLYAVNARAVEIWVQRLYLLEDEPWPRNSHIEVVAVELVRQMPGAEAPVTTLLPFVNREVKVARGSALNVHVQADAKRVVPDECTIYFRTEEGDRGRVSMKKFGRVHQQVQLFTYDGKPFRGILSNIAFDVRGFDHRVRDYRITVVESPAIIQTQLDCRFPDYMVDEPLSLWLPRVIDLTSATQLPRGTQIRVRAVANKDLRRVELLNRETNRTQVIDIPGDAADPRTIEFPLPALDGNLVLELTLFDRDGVMSDQPHRIAIDCVEDAPPKVDVYLKGIGTAVTPNVVIPGEGKIEDDYGVAESWFEVVLNDSQTHKFPFPRKAGGAVDARLDFRDQHSQPGGLDLKPKDKLNLVIKAQDKYDLTGQPNVGTGDQFQLEVVTADELLAGLDRKELALRRRFEQIIEEMTGMRDLLVRVKSTAGGAQGASGDQPEDQPVDPAARAAREQSLRLLRTQQSITQSLKSAQEIEGVAASFDDIREELINNRVDSEDRKRRLQEQIAEPLHAAVRDLFPELDRRLHALETLVPRPAESDPAADRTLEQTDRILVELDKVLQKMLELETYNELVNMVRGLIDEQDQLIQRSKAEQKKQALELLK